MGQWLRWQARYHAVQLAYKTGTLDERNYRYKNKETIGELLKIRAAIEGIPEQGIENIKQNIGIVFDKEKAFNYFFNPHATLEEATEYSGAAIDTGLTAYGAAKFLQSAVLAGKSGVTSIQQAAVNAAEKTGFKPLAVGGYGASVSGYKDIEKILSYAKDGVKGIGAAAGGSRGTGKAGDLMKSSPIEIPSSAKITEQMKTGYEQIKYKWSQDGFKFEARWHTRTPGAPIDQGNTWVITRTTPGTATGQRKMQEILVGENKWVTMNEWQKAITARKNGVATAAQDAMLEAGHWPAP